jgi:hypothetical protein
MARGELLEKEGLVCGEEGALLLMVLAGGGSAAIIWCSFGQGRGVVAGCEIGGLCRRLKRKNLQNQRREGGGGSP